MKDIVSYDKWMNEKELFIIEARKLGVDTTEVETPMGIHFKYGNTHDMFKIWLASTNRDGYKFVPVEPTEAVLEASLYRQWDDLSSPLENMDVLKYKAMIGAAE